MSPAAVDAVDSSSSTKNDATITTRRSSTPAASILVSRRSSPLKSPLRKSDSVDSYSVVSNHSNNSSPRSSLDSVDSAVDCQLLTPVKRIRRLSSRLLHSPVSSVTSPIGKAMMMQQYEVRSYIFLNASGNNDQNSRDSGFESSAGSSTSSHRSTPVDRSDSCDSIGSNGGVVTATTTAVTGSHRATSSTCYCMWDQCETPVLDGELLEHILSIHVQPLEKSTKPNVTGKYACQWKDCKVYNKPSRLYTWLERHVVEKHGGSRPYGCPVPGCRQRFGGRLAAERHINSHFEKSAAGDGGGEVCCTTDNVKNVLNETKKISVDDAIRKKITKNSLLTTSKVDDIKSQVINGGGGSGSSNGDGPRRNSAFERDNTVVLPLIYNNGNGGNLVSSECASIKKRNHMSKTSFTASAIDVEPLESQYVRDALAWQVSLAMTNERLASLNSSSPCRKRNSGINDQRNKRPRRCGTSDVATFQCKILARRFVDDDDDESDCEYFVGWSPDGYLPSLWMPKDMYKNSFTIAKNLITRIRSSYPSATTTTTTTS